MSEDLVNSFKIVYYSTKGGTDYTLEKYEEEILEKLLANHRIELPTEVEANLPQLCTEYHVACNEYTSSTEKDRFIFTDLIIESNTQQTLPARLHQFNNIHIKKDGALEIQENSSQWCILWATGKIIIEGHIVARKQKRTSEEVKGFTPDKKTISHQFLNEAQGGSGGAGGTSRGGSTNVNGGQGAYGTGMYGGGGGSAGGAIVMGPQSRGGSPGKTATDWKGALPADIGGLPTSKGGDGGRLSTFPNGGLLLMYCQEFECTGSIYLAGEHGVDGQNGGNGNDVLAPRGGHAGSGGGGGAPGGEGGRFVLISDKITPANPNIRLNGGFGGRGGRAGTPANGAQPGTAGENGQSGYRDFYSIDQWNAQ